MRPALSIQPLALAIGLALALAGPAAHAFPQDADEESAPAYQDRIIPSDQLAPLPEDEGESFDADGLPRSLDVQLLASRTERGPETFNEQGLTVGGFWETLDHGSFSLDATLLHADRSRNRDGDGWGGTATLWQRGLFLDGGWRGDNGVGVLNTALPTLSRDQYRFLLPSVPFAGASTDWRQASRNLQLMGSYGRGGVFDGARVVGFERSDGDVASLGAQWEWAPGWTGAATALATDGRLVPGGDGGVLVEENRTRALLVSNGWRSATQSLTLNLQSSGGDPANALGAWLDGRADQGRYQHRYGLFRLEPELAWGALPIANDAEGAYYRLNYSYARWNWNAGLDHIRSVSGSSFEGLYGNFYGRYQASTRLGYGGGLNVRDSDAGTAYSTQLFVDQVNRWGQSRLQWDFVDNGPSGGNSWEVKLDHTLPFRPGKRLSLSLNHGSLSYSGEAATRTTSVAFNGGIDLTQRLSLDGSARYGRGTGPAAFRGTDLNLNLAWRFARQWSLVGSIYENRGARRSPFILDPLAPDTFIDIPRDRSLFLSLRYQHRAGTASGVLGGPPGSPVGSITGSVYLDDNGDGQRAASEQPAANVTVLLDGLYAVRTDSNGEFTFPRVAVGAHVVTVVPDNLPLPWFVDEELDRRAVEVTVRDQQRVDIGARRQR